MSFALWKFAKFDYTPKKNNTTKGRARTAPNNSITELRQSGARTSVVLPLQQLNWHYNFGPAEGYPRESTPLWAISIKLYGDECGVCKCRYTHVLRWIGGLLMYAFNVIVWIHCRLLESTLSRFYVDATLGPITILDIYWVASEPRKANDQTLKLDALKWKLKKIVHR